MPVIRHKTILHERIWLYLPFFGKDSLWATWNCFRTILANTEYNGLKPCVECKLRISEFLMLIWDVWWLPAIARIKLLGQRKILNVLQNLVWRFTEQEALALFPTQRRGFRGKLEKLEIDYAVLYELLLIYAQSEFFLDKAKKNDKLRFLWKKFQFFTKNWRLLVLSKLRSFAFIRPTYVVLWCRLDIFKWL